MAATFYALIFGIVCVGLSQATPFGACPSGNAPLAVRYSGCDKLPCIFKKGQVNVVEWDFIAQNDITDMTVNIKAKFLMAFLNVYTQRKQCTDMKNANCPMKKGDKVTYVFEYDVPSYYPKWGSELQVYLYGNNELQSCFSMPVSLQ